MRCRAAVCLALSGLACLAAAMAAPMPDFPSPATVPYPQLRAQFESDGSIAALDEAARVAGLLDEGPGKVSADTCRKHASELEHAASHDPLGLSIWYYKERCAQLLGNEPERARSEQAFAALLRGMRAQVPPDNGQTPLPIYSIADGSALIDASGETVVSSYIDLESAADGVVWRVGLRDPDTGHEREISFDLLGRRLRLIHERDPAKALLVRVGAIDRATKNFSDAESGAGGVPTTVVRMGFDIIDTRDAHIKALAAKDDLSAAMVIGHYCFTRAKPACTTTAVDDLMTYAEKGDASAMVLLAYAYTRAEGFRHDEEAAKALMQGAAGKMGVGAAFQDYFLTGSLGEDTPFRRWAFDRLVEAAKSGDALAAGVAAWQAGVLPALDTDAARTQRLRDQAAKAGLGYYAAASTLAAEVRRKNGEAATRDAEAMAATTTPVWLRLYAVGLLADAYEYGNQPGVAIDPGKGLRWRTEEGMLGQVDAMRDVAWHYVHATGLQAPVQQAAAWFAGAATLGDATAALDLANLYAGDRKDLPADAAKKAVEMYQAFTKDAPDAIEAFAARRQLARLMIAGRGIARDPAGAKAMLTRDAEAGNADSAFELARALYSGEFGTRDPAGASQWIDRALARPDSRTMTLFAGSLYHGTRLPLDRQRAIALWTQAGTRGYLTAWNDMGWELCTAADAEGRDPGHGLETVRKAMSPRTPAGFVDSLAACQAAVGDFDSAIATQQRALAMLDPASDTAARMRERLDLYRAHHVYVQPTETPAGTAAPSDVQPKGTP